MLCECCMTKKAECKDWREKKDNLFVFWVCGECLNLADSFFFKKLYKNRKKWSGQVEK